MIQQHLFSENLSVSIMCVPMQVQPYRRVTLRKIYVSEEKGVDWDILQLKLPNEARLQTALAP